MLFHIFLSDDVILKIEEKCLSIGKDYHDFEKEFSKKHSRVMSFLTYNNAKQYIDVHIQNFLDDYDD